MEPWQSWAAVLLGGGAAWYYYRSRTGPRSRAGRATSASQKVDGRSGRQREGTRAKRARESSGASPNLSGTDLASSSVSISDKEKPRQRREEKSGMSSVNAASEPGDGEAAVSIGNDRPEENIDNNEFARQLSGLKAGTTLAPPAKAANRQKTLKQSRVNSSINTAHETVPSSQDVSTTSSTTGADADDDLSPAVSPTFGATPVGQRVSADVSDMLEAPAPGPSVLRLTESKEPPRAQRAHAPKTPQPEETKKQRQNRKKAEEKRLAREADEKERRILLEKQLRTAREAEGRPAKNGVASSAKPPATPAWTTAKPKQSEPVARAEDSAGANLPLLDTFDDRNGAGEHDTTNARPTGVNGVSSASKSAGSRPAWDRDLPSEEEQMRMLKEMNDGGWSTVPKGKKNKKKAGGANGNSTGNESSENDRAGQNVFAQTFEAPTNVNGSVQASDSDWAVV